MIQPASSAMILHAPPWLLLFRMELTQRTRFPRLLHQVLSPFVHCTGGLTIVVHPLFACDGTL